MPMWKYVIAWAPMVVIAVANGAVRESWYGKRVTELYAHQISTVSALGLLGAYTWGVIRLWPPESPKEALAVGLIWLVLTVAFEFLFGRYGARHSWRRLLHNYNVLAGRIWILVLVWVAIAPMCFSVYGGSDPHAWPNPALEPTADVRAIS
jgi:hypothetical protein